MCGWAAAADGTTSSRTRCGHTSQLRGHCRALTALISPRSTLIVGSSPAGALQTSSRRSPLRRAASSPHSSPRVLVAMSSPSADSRELVPSAFPPPSAPPSALARAPPPDAPPRSPAEVVVRRTRAACDRWCTRTGRWQGGVGGPLMILGYIWGAFLAQWFLVAESLTYPSARWERAWRVSAVVIPALVSLALWLVHYGDPGVIPPRRDHDPAARWHEAQPTRRREERAPGGPPPPGAGAASSPPPRMTTTTTKTTIAKNDARTILRPPARKRKRKRRVVADPTRTLASPETSAGRSSASSSPRTY